MGEHFSYEKKIPDFLRIQADLTRICKILGVRRLTTFGSINTDRFGPASDIDFLVKFDDLKCSDSFNRYFELREQLEILFKRPVELVFEKEFENPYFRETVNNTKRVIYEGCPEKIICRF